MIRLLFALMLVVVATPAAGCDFTRKPSTCEDVACWVNKLGERKATWLAKRFGATTEDLERAKACIPEKH